MSSSASRFGRCAIVGDGRVGRALAARLDGFDGPFGRGFDGRDFDVVLLAVPDTAIHQAASVIEVGPVVGHCSGALGLDVLAPHERFGMHPLMAVTHTGADFRGAGAAIAGSTGRALDVARGLAAELGLVTVEIADSDRVAYHASAAIASNFLITLEDMAEQVMATTGATREILVPLVRASVENWATLGGPDALTGPIARGDDEIVARHRLMIVERAPEFVAMFDALVERTRALAARRTPQE